MTATVLQLDLRTERDVVQARQRAREVAAALGLDNQDQIRMATATSEIARNAFRYALNGKVFFSISENPPQRLEVTVSDSGRGITNLEEILEGRYRSATGLGKGILGTRRLMDEFEIDTTPQGTTVRMAKRLPLHNLVTKRSIAELNQKLKTRPPESPYEEIDRQNQELLKTLQDLRSRQEELELLNHELEDTNRGVVALYAELDERADYLRRASELKTKFLSNVSHEFRTPLNSIISLARLLLGKMDGDLTAEQVKQVHFIESSARDLQEMVNDLLDLAKVEAGKIRIRTKRFDVQELFSALKGMLKPLLADNSSVDLVFEDTANLTPLQTDEGKVSQILRNLISNSLKFTPQGQVTVSARAAENNEVLFIVADTGIGIPAEHHETIFREFSQLENPFQERHHGTGLGLPLCRNLARLLGGRLWMESEVEKGSTFFVQLPAIYVGELVAQPFDASPLPPPEFNRTPILFLEDNLETAAALESYVRDSEFQAILASTIPEAEAWMARHVPAAVVSDIYIGNDLAWNFLASAREKWPDMPLIVSSIYDVNDESEDAKIDACLSKPTEQAALLRELRRLTGKQGTRRLLIADDNDVARYVLRELLDQPWLDIHERNNGDAALKEVADNPPDAMILDLLMPDMSGLDVLRKLRADAATENLPVLIYTSKRLNLTERAQLESLRARIVRKEDVSTRLSAKPFLDWLRSAGLVPETGSREENV